MDRLIYTGFMFTTLLTAFCMGLENVFYIKLLHLIKTIIMMTHRYISFKRQGKQEYLWEFCYFVTLITVIYLCFDLIGYNPIVIPLYGSAIRLNDIVFIFLYAMTSGPMVMAVIANNDRLYFHSPDHLISVFLHLGTAMTMWKIRWYDVYDAPIDFSLCGIFSTYVIFIITCIIPYMIWFIGYSVIMFWLRRKIIETNNYETMYKWILMNKEHYINKVMLLTNNETLRKVIFMLSHVLCTLIGLLISSITWNSIEIGFILLAFILIKSIWASSKKICKVFEEKKD